MTETPTRSSAVGDMVGKALGLLDLLGDHPHGASLSELSGRSGYPLSTTHRLLASLIRGGYASLDEADRRYHLGLRVFALGHRVSTARGFSGVVLPQMEWAAAETAEAVLMSVLDTDRQLYVHYVPGPQQVGVVGERGRHGPLHCTAMGKVLVAFAPKSQSQRLVETIELTQLGPNAITDRDEFRAEIALVKAQEYAIADQEHEAGIRAVAVPITDTSGVLRAALSIAAPTFRCPVDRLIDFLPVLHAAAATIRTLLPTS